MKFLFRILHFVFLFYYGIQNSFPQEIQARVLDIMTDEPLPNVTIHIKQSEDTSIQKTIVTDTDGTYETIAPIQTGIGTPQHLESVWLNYTPDHVEVHIADPKLRSLKGAQLYSMNARLVDLIEKEQEGQYSVFRINKDVLG